MMKKDKEEEDEEEILSSFAAHKNGDYCPSERERAQVRQLLNEGYTVKQITGAIERAFGARLLNSPPIRSFGFVQSYVHRRLYPAGQPPTEISTEDTTEGTVPTGGLAGEFTGARNAEDVPFAADAVHRPRSTEDKSQIAQAYELLHAASIYDTKGTNSVFYDTPGIRLGLRRFLDMPDPFLPDEIYNAVLAAVSRSISPDHLVGYVGAVLKNARKKAKEQERLQQAVSAVTHTNLPVKEPEVSLAGEVDEKKRLWRSALYELELQMTRATFDMWIKPVELLSWENDLVIVSVPNEYVRDWLERRLIIPIQRTLSDIARQTVRIEFRIVDI